MSTPFAGTTALTEFWAKVKALVSGKQDELVSGTNIKTVNSQSLLGSGNITTPDTYDRLRYNNVVWVNAAVAAKALAANRTGAGYEPLVAGNSYDIAFPILYAPSAVGRSNWSGGYLAYPNVSMSTLGVTVETTQYGQVLWLKGTLSGDSFTLAPEPFITMAKPASADGYLYLPIGWTKDTNTFFFQHTHQFYAFTDGAFRPVESDGGGITPADYVVAESHTSTGGYRKWNSGRMEAWTKRTISTTVSTTWGNLYRSSDYYTGGSWPEAFQSLHHCWTHVTADGGDMAWCASVSSATTSRGDNVYILRGSTLTSSKTFVVNWYGVGTWK